MQALTELAALRVEDDDLRASIEYTKGVTLAVSSGLFIGASFIIKKKGLLAAGESGLRAAAGGFSYLREPLWWLGMVTMIGGECANFAAYAYAPAIVVTPLGATTIVSSAIFANCFLGETLHACGAVGCALCVLGSIVLVSFAPEEAQLQSVEEIWRLATQPQFLAYTAMVVLLALWLMLWVAPRHGKRQVLVYVSICSLVGSLSVVSVKALGIALKLSIEGRPQLHKRETLVFGGSVLLCIATQMNYLNKALDTFGTAIVSSVYYVFFTFCTVTASMIMYKDWENQTATSISWQVVGFIVLVLGVYVLTATKDSRPGCASGMQAVLGGCNTPEYKAVAVSDIEVVPICDMGDATRS